jgi:predicted enzyme related to lactoylglutathione lyase
VSTVQTKVGLFVWHENLSTNIEAAKAFYTGLLGWGIEVYKPGEMDYPMIAAGGITHGGFWAIEDGPASWIGHVNVEDVDAAAQKAESLGGKVLNGPMDMPEVGRFATIQDPHGGVVSAYKSAGEMPGGAAFLWDELYSPDVETAKRFYSEVFGWTTSEMDMGEMGAYTIFSRGETQVAGLMKKPEEMPGPASWHPYVAADDVDQEAAKAVGLGATQLVPPADVPGVGRIALFLDPNGAMFGLFKPAES